MISPNPKVTSNDPDLIDRLNRELAILKICIYGLYHCLQEYDQEIYLETSAATSIQLARFEKLLQQIN
jgi:hypothetical protein